MAYSNNTKYVKCKCDQSKTHKWNKNGNSIQIPDFSIIQKNGTYGSGFLVRSIPIDPSKTYGTIKIIDINKFQ